MRKLIAGNWKCNPPTRSEAEQLFAGIKRGLDRLASRSKKADIALFPPFVYLGFAPKTTAFSLGAQNCFWEQKGTFTGEVSPKMLKSLRVKYVLVGHSKRRQMFDDDNETVNKKLKLVLKTGLIPVLCIGETAEEKHKGQTFKVLETELKQGLAGVSRAQIEKVVIAYEPIWAIGTGASCCCDDALTTSLFIRKIISKMFHRKAGRSIKVLYGGSVNPANAAGYLGNDWISGLLVGGESLEVEDFLEIIKQA